MSSISHISFSLRNKTQKEVSYGLLHLGDVYIVFCNYVCLVSNALDICILSAVIFVKRNNNTLPFLYVTSLVFHHMNSVLLCTM